MTKIESFSISIGILQGDTLTSFFFLIALDYILGLWLDKINNKTYCPDSYFTDLDIVENITLLVDILEDAQQRLADLQEAVVFVSLHLI